LYDALDKVAKNRRTHTWVEVTRLAMNNHAEILNQLLSTALFIKKERRNILSTTHTHSEGC